MLFIIFRHQSRELAAFLVISRLLQNVIRPYQLTLSLGVVGVSRQFRFGRSNQRVGLFFGGDLGAAKHDH